jgi:hypothetical protein
MTAMGYEGAGGVYPGHYYGGCEDTRQHTWGGYHQQVAHPQGSPSQRYPYYDTRYTFIDIPTDIKYSDFHLSSSVIPATVTFIVTELYSLTIRYQIQSYIFLYSDTTYRYYVIRCKNSRRCPPTLI